MSTTSATATAMVGAGLLTSTQRNRDPWVMAPQKNVVVAVPSAPPAGTA